MKPPIKLRYNCATCPGYCCSHARIAISDYDIARLAKHFGLSFEAAKRKFTYHYQTKEVDEQLLRHKKDHIYKSVCRFFDTDERRCTVYEARPAICRAFPGDGRCGYYDFLSFERRAQNDPNFVAVTTHK